jgi:hypothetical protein
MFSFLQRTSPTVLVFGLFALLIAFAVVAFNHPG